MAINQPQRRLTGDAPVEFMETRMTLPDGPVFVNALDSFLPKEEVAEQARKERELWEATAKDKDGLIVAMSRFQDKLRKDDPALRQVDLQTCQWPQVMEEFKGALKYYEVEKRKGVGGAMLTCLRKLGEHSDAFSRWIDLLPNGDYGSPICGILTSSVTIRELAWTALTSSAGAFKLIISAAARLNKIEISFYEALRDIPEAVSKAQRYMEIYSDVKAYQLSQKTAQLYSAILNTLENILLSLGKSTWKRVGSAIFKVDKDQDQLGNSIAQVRLRAVEINEEAKICHEIRARKMDEDIASGFGGIPGVFRKILAEVEVIAAERIRRLLLSSQDIDPHTRQPYRNIDEGKPVRASKKRKQIKEPQTAKNEALTVDQVLDILAYHAETLTIDVDRCRTDGESMSYASKDRASFIACSSQLRDWLLDVERSSSLLIIGNSGSTDFSPLSFLVAELTSLYTHAEGIIGLAYFCDLHTDEYQNPRANSTGLINSLLGQILSQDRDQFNLDFISGDLREGIQNDNIDGLCTAFKELVLQMQQPMVIFCFIDAISIYETPDRKEATESVLQMLTDLAAHQNKAVVFKLLITDPGMSCDAERLFSDSDIFLVPGDIDGDGQGVLMVEGLGPT